MTAVTGDFFKLDYTFILAPVQSKEAELSCPGPTSTNRQTWPQTPLASSWWMSDYRENRNERKGGDREGKRMIK